MPTITPGLVFSQPPLTTSPVGLVFGEFASAIPSIQVAASIQLGGVTVSALVVKPVKVDISFALGGVTVAAGVFYDNRVTPWKDCRVASGIGVGVPTVKTEDSAWSLGENQRGGTAQAWQRATLAKSEPIASHTVSLPKHDSRDQLWQVGDRRSRSVAGFNQTAIRTEVGGSQLWDVADHIRSIFDGSSQTGIFKQLVEVADFKAGRPALVDFGGPVGASLHYKGISFFTGPWGIGGAAAPGTNIVEPPIVPPEHKWWWDANLLFQCPPLAVPDLVFGGITPCSVDAPPATVIVPIRRVYMIINEASLRRVDGNISLPTFSLSLSLDVGSWTWSMNASLPGNTLSALEPSSSGANVEVEAMINGVAYRALVDGIGRQREFAKSSISIQCRGLTSLLDSPVSPVQQFINSTSRTAQQLMGDVLTINGAPMPWTVNWGLEDWLVPAGVFAHQGSYISALNAIAAAAGGYVQPHASLQQINVLPKYAVGPWEWGSVTPDFELPSDVTTKEGITWTEKARYNRVYVSGQQQGVLGQVTRAGTDGSLLAPMVTDALITTAAAARQRGLSILADTGRQAALSLRLPVLAETGIITPGKFVQYVDGATTHRGIVRSTSVEVGMPEVWQTLGVETHA